MILGKPWREVYVYMSKIDLKSKRVLAIGSSFQQYNQHIECWFDYHNEDIYIVEEEILLEVKALNFVY